MLKHYTTKKLKSKAMGLGLNNANIKHSHFLQISIVKLYHLTLTHMYSTISPRLLVGYMGFVCATHLYPYSVDSCCALCHEPFCSFSSDPYSLLIACTSSYSMNHCEAHNHEPFSFAPRMSYHLLERLIL
jgi:hypothetical protein